MLIFMAWKTVKNNHKMIENENRLLLSSALILDQNVVLKDIVDHDQKTAILNLNHLGQQNNGIIPGKNTANHEWPFRLDIPFIQMDVGLSHFPGRPPVINHLKKFRIWPGNQKSKITWQSSGRPRDIELVFFRQRLVDADREYKLIGEPVFWQSFRFHLKNKYGPQEFALKFKDKIGPSENFPGQIDFIWCRVEIKSYYQGSNISMQNHIAISEIEYLFDKKFRRRI